MSKTSGSEEEVFQRLRFAPERMIAYGFQREENQFIYETDFMDGAFHLILTVSNKGEVHGQVIDMMNEEEYRPLRQENFSGPYVNSVRENYRQLLETVASAVCANVLFASDQANRITDRILSSFDVKPDFPWREEQFQTYGTFRHADTKKWFALIMNVKRSALLKNKDSTLIDIINLKTQAADKDAQQYPGSVFPAYHMNHQTWISVVLDESMSDDAVMKLIRQSFELTA
jgi:predicted DNA-binding protein (MmcQ/YjbR family)